MLTRQWQELLSGKAWVTWKHSIITPDRTSLPISLIRRPYEMVHMVIWLCAKTSTFQLNNLKPNRIKGLFHKYSESILKLTSQKHMRKQLEFWTFFIYWPNTILTGTKWKNCTTKVWNFQFGLLIKYKYLELDTEKYSSETLGKEFKISRIASCKQKMKMNLINNVIIWAIRRRIKPWIVTQKTTTVTIHFSLEISFSSHPTQLKYQSSRWYRQFHRIEQIPNTKSIFFKTVAQRSPNTIAACKQRRKINYTLSTIIQVFHHWIIPPIKTPKNPQQLRKF